jgi:methylated-DNA-[protein]-cysteine S-methyltransferase
MSDLPRMGEAIEAWLKGEEVRGEWREVTSELDRFYAKGPGERLTGDAKMRLKKALAEAQSRAIFYAGLDETRIGSIWAACCEDSVIALDIGVSEGQFISRLEGSFKRPLIHSQESLALILSQLQEYLAGCRRSFELALNLDRLTEYQRQVLWATARIDYGQVTTYGEIARRIGKPRSARAVGQVLAHNPIPIVIPCHRVLGADGSLHGYSGGRGIETKAQLLSLEGVLSLGDPSIPA